MPHPISTKPCLLVYANLRSWLFTPPLHYDNSSAGNFSWGFEAASLVSTR